MFQKFLYQFNQQPRKPTLFKVAYFTTWVSLKAASTSSAGFHIIKRQVTYFKAATARK